MESKIEISQEILTHPQIQNHLYLTAKDFAPFTKDFMQEYAVKLTKYANIIVLRENSEIKGFIFYYANIIPVAYITRVWVSDDLRGRGFSEIKSNNIFSIILN